MRLGDEDAAVGVQEAVGVEVVETAEGAERGVVGEGERGEGVGGTDKVMDSGEGLSEPEVVAWRGNDVGVKAESGVVGGGELGAGCVCVGAGGGGGVAEGTVAFEVWVFLQ